MIYLQVFLFILIFCFGAFSVIEDVRFRKVSNKLNLIFFLISFALFLFGAFSWFGISEYVYALVAVLIAYGLYRFNLWGGADGKIFIALSLLLIFFGGGDLFAYFGVNMIVFYTLTILLVAVFMTSAREKVKAFRKIDLFLVLFLMLLVLVLVMALGWIYGVDYSDTADILMFFVLVLVLVMALGRYVKKYFGKVDVNVRVVISFALFCTLLLYGGFMYLFSLVFLFCFKVFLKWISELVGHVKSDKGGYNSPFSIYLFFAALFTLIVQTSVMQIIVRFFF